MSDDSLLCCWSARRRCCRRGATMTVIAALFLATASVIIPNVLGNVISASAPSSDHLNKVKMTMDTAAGASAAWASQSGTVTDQILAVFFSLERFLTRTTAPIEAFVLKYVSNNFPDVTHASSQWLSSIKSSYTDALPLMNPFHVCLLVLMYFAMVFGGKFMMRFRDRGFDVKSYALLNNLVLVSISTYMFVEIIRQAIISRYSLFGNPIVPPPNGLPMAKIISVFYLSKILEFNDTFIMVLKKNFRQITFLHVYHHFSIFMIWWLVTFWAPNGESYFSAALNSFIHIIMYSYYLLSGLGFKSVSIIRPLITRSQMTQFVCMMVQATYNISVGFFSTENDRQKQYPYQLSVLLWIYMVTMLSLFGNFYRKSYKAAKANKMKVKSQ